MDILYQSSSEKIKVGLPSLTFPLSTEDVEAGEIDP